MNAVKVHITIADSVRRDQQARNEALRAITNAVRMLNVNQARFDRFGILTAEVDPETIGTIQRMDVVRSVSRDEVRRAVG